MISIDGLLLPNKPLTNTEILDSVAKLKMKNFRGVFQRDNLPKRAYKKECGILNLDHARGSGTHWTAWFKNNGEKFYFDSYGLQPPLEVIDYLKSPIYYNTEQIQPRNEVFCGHLCLYILKEMMTGRGLQEIINELF